MSKTDKIEKLTPEQEADLLVFREEAIKKALRTDFASEDTMVKVVADLYKSRGLSEPMVFVFDDPVQCMAARAILRGKESDILNGHADKETAARVIEKLKKELGRQRIEQVIARRYRDFSLALEAARQKGPAYVALEKLPALLEKALDDSLAKDLTTDFERDLYKRLYEGLKQRLLAEVKVFESNDAQDKDKKTLWQRFWSRVRA